MEALWFYGVPEGLGYGLCISACIVELLFSSSPSIISMLQEMEYFLATCNFSARLICLKPTVPRVIYFPCHPGHCLLFEGL